MGCSTPKFVAAFNPLCRGGWQPALLQPGRTERGSRNEQTVQRLLAGAVLLHCLLGC